MNRLKDALLGVFIVWLAIAIVAIIAGIITGIIVLVINWLGDTAGPIVMFAIAFTAIGIWAGLDSHASSS